MKKTKGAKCPECGSTNTMKNGTRHGMQWYECKGGHELKRYFSKKIKGE